MKSNSNSNLINLATRTETLIEIDIQSSKILEVEIQKGVSKTIKLMRQS